jgi:outer membrane protein TolC
MYQGVLAALLTACALDLRADTLTLGYADAIAYAQAHRQSFRARQLRERVTGIDVTNSYTAFLPSAGASIDFRDNIQLPTSLLPAAFAPDAPQGGLIPLQFGTQFTLTPVINVTLPLVDPQLYVNVQTARIASRLGEQQTRATREDLIIEVSRAYYTLLLDSSRLAAAALSLQRERADYESRAAQQRYGTALGSDLSQAAVQRERARNDLLRANRNMSIDRYELSRVLGARESDVVLVTETLDTVMPLDTEALNTRVAEASGSLGNLPRVLISELTHASARTAVTKSKLAFSPVLSAYAFIGTEAQNDTLSRLFSNWYASKYVGALLSVPIFDKLQRFNRLRELRLRADAAEADAVEALAMARNDLRRSAGDLMNANDMLLRRLLGLRSAEEILRVTEARYGEGVAAEADAVAARASLYQAQADLAQARYDFLLAQLNYKRAAGELTYGVR